MAQTQPRECWSPFGGNGKGSDYPPNLEGKVAIVTGANCGIGKNVAQNIAALGAEVFFACRSEDRANAAIQEVAALTGNDKLYFLKLDLADLASVRSAATEFLSKGKPLHILVNNAGLASQEHLFTKDGHELHFGTNHLGPFLFTKLLLPKMTATEKSRIVFVSSDAHKWSNRIDYDDLTMEKSGIGMLGMKAYARSKLCNVYNMRKLHRLLCEQQGCTGAAVPNPTVNAMHPGAVSTEIARNGGVILKFIMRLFFRSVEKGAETAVWLAVHSDAEGQSGQYFMDKKPSAITALAQEEEEADRLWDKSVELTDASGTTPGGPAGGSTPSGRTPGEGARESTTGSADAQEAGAVDSGTHDEQ
mmetsp:Transcript_9844/g.24577  ORF Transcript_9844/g.24577 Transcript_9844/m.24577 type:complete len:361 (+) Transcript_9844:50-1132(+)|eukprot:CAMPEP_0177640714 /NCGR_PEP_ID=MMETSP0447-20121125/6687_1 /TAXON_ID=0 /ORGANISM="Stygamoeba regulata, Strain BSH-02190019" /LENGTH=360 /DNA_ID=CAMNT_0019142797 /DNA_START=45 /DNA_END=1127 /DNA_ORIENTATION=+